MIRSLRRKLGLVPRIRRPTHFDLVPLWKLVERVGEREQELARADAASLAARARSPADDEDATVEVFAIVREVARRTIGLRAFDVQLLGAFVLQGQAIAEMQTGEGKTLVAVFCAARRALSGQRVHVLTANDYLAARDAEWMGPVYEALGLRVACVTEPSTPEQRRDAYSFDVLYATAQEVGFDFLRDRLATEPSQQIQPPLGFAIVDEVDSILIDEARVPLVIAGGDEPATEIVRTADAAVRDLTPEHYALDADSGGVWFTQKGLDHLEEVTPFSSDEVHRRLLLALQAHLVLRRDVDYIVRDGRVEIVDELTGRVPQRRRWPDGLHTAVEAKEGVEPTPDAGVLSSITVQGLVERYEGVAGMTGTAETSAAEFAEGYGLPVALVPTHRPCIRVDEPDRAFATVEEKLEAVVAEIAACRTAGRPVLVGTASVAESERLASSLRRGGVECSVLNARQDSHEAEVIARAGIPGAVTISTNMAGRGTDIKLGGPDETARDDVVAAGGLYVIGTTRHDSPRIDRQLRGRAGRQGDPGTSRFFVSATDDIVLRYGVDEYLLDTIDVPADAQGRIERAQETIDWVNMRLRQHVVAFGRVVEEQRRIVHAWREDVLHSRAPSLFRSREPEAASRFDPARLDRLERDLTLALIDRSWADHLQDLREIRFHIGTASMGRDSVDAFRAQTVRLLHGMLTRVREEVVEVLYALDPHQDVDLDSLGLDRPTARFTYLLADPPSRAERHTWADVLRGMMHDALRA